MITLPASLRGADNGPAESRAGTRGPGAFARRGTVDFTQGSISVNLVRLAWPLVAGNLLQTVYNLVDMFWVGRLGATEIAAVSIVFPTDWLLVSVGMGITVAGAAFVSQWTGAKRPREAERVAAQMISVAVLSAVLLSTVGHLVRLPLLRLMGATGEIFPDALAYMTVIIWSVPFTFLFFAFRSSLRGAGDTMRPMYLTVFSNLLNVVLDPVLIFGWGPAPAMGVAGAAWATLISRALAGLVGLGFLLSGKLALRIRPADLVPRWETARELLRLGLPASLDGAARSFSSVAMVAIVARLGAVATAAYGIVNRVMSMIWTTSAAVGQAVGTGVGQNLGAGQLARSRQVAWTGVALDLVFLGAGGLLSVALAPGIMRVFVHDAEVIEQGAAFLRVVGWSFGFAGGVQVVQGAFQGAGRTTASMILALLNHWVLRFPLAIALIWGLGWGPPGLWWSMFFSSTAGFAVAALWLWRGGWRQAVIPVSPSHGPPAAGEGAGDDDASAPRVGPAPTAAPAAPAAAGPLARSGSHGNPPQ